MNDISIALSPLAYAIVTFLVIGVITLVKKLYIKDWYDSAIIIAAAIVGAIAGHYVTGVGGLAGLLVGLNASGLVTTAIKFGSTSSDPSPVTPATATDPTIVA